MISGIVTLMLLVVFVAAWIWAWQPGRRKEFESAAMMPLQEHVETVKENKE